MTLQTVGQTANFVYLYQDSLADAAVAKQRAQYFLTSGFCEKDLATLEPWFGVTGGFGSSNPISTHIDRSGSLGTNGGYQTGGKTVIQVAPFDGGPGGSTTLGEAQCRAVFVAEFAEVLMSYRNQATGKTTWQPRNSMGEALSEVCEALLHPDGYYPPGNIGPRIGNWLNSSPRPNWIDNVEPTDQHAVSYGCGMVFIYYLKDQLGYSMKDIITKAGTSLAQTYTNLTGKTGAWAAFTTLLDLRYPPGPNYSPTSDDLFPIEIGILDSLALFPDPVGGGSPSRGTVTLQKAVTTDTTVTLAVINSNSGPVPLPLPAGSSSPVASISTPTLTIKAGSTSGSFNIQTTKATPPTKTRTATIVAVAVETKYALLTVNE